MVSYRLLVVILAALCLILTITTTTTQVAANAVIDGPANTKLTRSTKLGKLYHTAGSADGLDVELPVLHVWGSNYYEQGYAQGQLMAQEISDFIFVAVPLFYQAGDVAKASMNRYLPADILQYMNSSRGDDITLSIIAATEWMYEQQRPFFTQLAINFDDELRGIADGVCDELVVTKKLKTCDKHNALVLIRSWNFFPDLNRLGCTLTATYGAANNNNATMPQPLSENDKLYHELFNIKSQQALAAHQDVIQSRLLDFGIGPFVHWQVLMVRHFDNFNYQDVAHVALTTDPIGATTRSQDFVSQSFPGMVGVVTSASKILTQSQKVFLDFNNNSDDDGGHAPKLTALQSLFDFTPAQKRALTHLTAEQRDAIEHLSQSVQKIQLNLQQHDRTALQQLRRNVVKTFGSDNFLQVLAQYLTPQLPAVLKARHDISTILLHNMYTYTTQPALLTFVKNNMLHRTTAQNVLVDDYHLQYFSGLQVGLTGFRPGTMSGVADLWAMRYFIEKAGSLQDVINFTHRIPKTWPIWLLYSTSAHPNNTAQWGQVNGVLSPVGMVEYGPYNLTYLDDHTITNLTLQPVFDNILYVDKRPQPSPGTILQDIWTANYGDMPATWQLSTIPQKSSSGDVHAVIFDWNQHEYYVSIGKMDLASFDWVPNGKAYQRPFVRYNWYTLLNEAQP